MIFRAIFWIGLVSLLMPHEPDLGLGRPGAGISLPAMVNSWGVSSLSRPGNLCRGEGGACAGGLGASLETASGRNPANDRERSLADVKNEIDASIKARAAYAL